MFREEDRPLPDPRPCADRHPRADGRAVRQRGNLEGAPELPAPDGGLGPRSGEVLECPLSVLLVGVRSARGLRCRRLRAVRPSFRPGCPGVEGRPARRPVSVVGVAGAGDVPRMAADCVAPSGVGGEAPGPLVRDHGVRSRVPDGRPDVSPRGSDDLPGRAEGLPDPSPGERPVLVVLRDSESVFMELVFRRSGGLHGV